ncbi:MAG TPA: glutaredoxin family protein [Casimicrobiaceae bacterium]|nr:glutaredoxin family protein [Casimicrobiaceae bacterium]
MTSIGIRPMAASALALLLLGASALAAAQSQQVYRYVDADGRVVYSDKPPPADARDAQAKRIGRNTIETSTLSYAAAQAEQRFPVTLYTFGCGLVCDSASGLLNKRGIPHTVVDVGQSDGAEKLKRLTGGLDAPALQVGDQYTTGYSETRWQSMLTDAGYPQTPPPRTAPIARAPAPPSAAAGQANAAPAAPSAAEPAAAPAPKGDYPK